MKAYAVHAGACILLSLIDCLTSNLEDRERIFGPLDAIAFEGLTKMRRCTRSLSTALAV